MTPTTRFRMIWMLLTTNDAALITEALRRIPADELRATGEAIVRNTQAVLEGMQAVQTGMLDELGRQTEALNELSARMTSVEQLQRDAAEHRTQNLDDLKKEIADIRTRLERGDQRFDYIDAMIKAEHRSDRKGA